MADGRHEILALCLNFFAAVRCACGQQAPLVLTSPSQIVTCSHCGRSYAVTKMAHEVTDGEPNTAVEISEATTLHRPARDVVIRRVN